MDFVPDHPDIVAAQLTGYPSPNIYKRNQIGVCATCNEAIYDYYDWCTSQEGEMFCSPQCHNLFYANMTGGGE